jgi:DNA processing protein
VRCRNRRTTPPLPLKCVRSNIIIDWGPAVDETKGYWIGFNLVKGIGTVRLRALLNTFGDIKSAWEAPVDALRASGLSANLVENLVRLRSSVSLEKICDDIQAKGIEVITWEDPNYPERLREIDGSPPVLYLRGELKSEDEWAVAIVGTRRVTSYGRQATESIAGTLANSGVTVVSGLARGVDAIAHQAALEAGGRTLAVLGCGVDRVYPPEHRRLVEQISLNGALISDYPLGTPPEGQNFPPRNRIIAGLSMAVVIVEAGQRSGALITANFAVEQGRDVFAVPGNIYAPQSKGTNRLIQQGAHPLLAPKDVLDALDLTMVTEHRAARAVLPANATEAQLFGLLGQESLHIDEIRAQADLPIEEVTATLALMELKGMVRQLGGMRYIAVREAREDYQVNE